MNDEDKMNQEVIEKLKEMSRLLAAGGNAEFETLFPLFSEAAVAVAEAVEKRETGKEGHHQRVTNLARAIGTELILRRDQIDGLVIAAMIHDIGKISVPAEILGKSTRLTMTETEQVKMHSRSGHDLVKDLAFRWPVARILLEHHERMDGSGYPNGLTGDHLLMESRVLSVADVVDAITSPRAYRPARDVDVALYDIKGYRGIRHDPDVVDACLTLFNKKGYKLADD